MPSFFIPALGLRVTVGRHSIPGLYPWARIVLRRAQAKAPVRSGRLRSRMRIVATPSSLRVVSDAKNKGFLYAAVQEKRRPYLRPAIRK